jgi:poly-gamma-glutamate capsule biosynthesis protein CapA/YwtB (metallophosphatase superfamily)
MLGRITVFLFLTSCITCLKGQEPGLKTERIALIFAGDIMGHDEQIKAAWDPETHIYNYDRVFNYIREDISEADIAIGNLEVTLAGQPFSGYPQFSSPAELAVACKNAGFDFLVTANNHSADRGINGIVSTINRLDSLGIEHTGTFRDRAQRDTLYPALICKNGFTLSVLNYTYGTNGIAVPPPAIVNLIDKNVIGRDIETAKRQNPDAIIAIMHWGTEYDTIPSKSQTDLVNFLLDNGVDLVIGSHPHVIQKIVWTRDDITAKGKVIVYSLGNFVSNQRRTWTDGGIMVRIILEKNRDSTVVSDVGYMLTWVYTPVEDSTREFFILPCEKFEDKPEFFLKASDFQKMKAYIQNARHLLNSQNINVEEITDLPLSKEMAY